MPSEDPDLSSSRLLFNIVRKRMAIIANIVAGAAFLAGAGGAHAAIPKEPQAKIVLQSKYSNEPRHAAWACDNSFVITSDERLYIWDIPSGDIIDRIDLPALPSGDSAQISRLTIDAQSKIYIQLEPRSDRSTNDREASFVYALAQNGPWQKTAETPLPDGCTTGRTEDGWLSGDGRLLLTHYPYHGTQVIDLEKRDEIRIRDAEVDIDSGSTIVPSSDESRFFPQPPDLPKQHRWRPGGRIVLEQVVAVLDPPEPRNFSNAAMSPDGKHIALQTNPVGISEKYGERIVIYDLLNSTFRQRADIGSRERYSHMRWLSADHLLIQSKPSVPAFLWDVQAGRELDPKIRDHCPLVPVGEKVLIGGVLAYCDPAATFTRPDNIEDPGATGLMRYDIGEVGEGWRSLNEADFKSHFILDIAASPDRRTVAVLSGISGAASGPNRTMISIVDIASGEILARNSFKPQVPASAPERQSGTKHPPSVSFTPDGRIVRIGQINGRAYIWKPSSGAPPKVAPAIEAANRVRQIDSSADGQIGIEYDAPSRTLTSVRTEADQKTRDLMYSDVIGAGKIANSPMIWAATAGDGIKLGSLEPGSGNFEKMTTYIFPGNEFFSLSSNLLYDTNLGADTDRFRWLVDDDPLSSLGPQTFMRDNFQPRLARRTFECVAQNSCDTALKPATDIAGINRVTPTTTINRMSAGTRPDMAFIHLSAREGTRPQTPNGKTRSGIYNLRLFRDGSLIAQYPAVNETGHSSGIERWRELNRLQPDADGRIELRIPVTLPTSPDSSEVTFTAYAFNEDRIKSDTATGIFEIPASAKPRKPRAFVVTIGIDRYDGAWNNLQFAAADAQIIADRLATIPGHEVRRVSLLGTNTADGGTFRVTREMIGTTLGILSGAPRREALRTLKTMGVDASPLEQATPDDIVILSFAGHGWADAQGNFFLVPVEGVMDETSGRPILSTLLSSATISQWLQPIDAREIAFIIDACHAGASVDAGGFKPGPMGDAGLGQLAFDKGIRILAATQGDDVAMEDAQKGQGLLTYALAREGITETGGQADLDGDGNILLDEWLRYAVQRMPSLGDRAGQLVQTADGSRGFSFTNRVEIRKRIQEPALFDFTGKSSAVILRAGIR